MCVGNVFTRKNVRTCHTFCACDEVLCLQNPDHSEEVKGRDSQKVHQQRVTEKTSCTYPQELHARAAQPTAIISGSEDRLQRRSHVRMSRETLGDETETLSKPWKRGEHGGALHRGVQHVGTLLRGLASAEVDG